MEQEPDLNTGSNKNINPIDEYRDKYSDKDDGTTTAINNSRLKDGVVTTTKGSNDDNKNIAMGYKNYITDNQYIHFAKTRLHE